MTGFTRIVIVLSMVRHAFGMPETPPNSVLVSLALFLTLFGMGFSWGGFESLVIPFDCSSYRTATTWNPGGPTLRFHIGLENLDDLKADLERGFMAFDAAT